MELDSTGSVISEAGSYLLITRQLTEGSFGLEVKINSLEVKGHWRSLQFRFRDRAILCSAFVRCVVTYCARACVQIKLQLTPQKVCHV